MNFISLRAARRLLLPIALCFQTTLLSYNPKISIITSVYDGDQFIEQFLDDITQQTIFDQCELIMINANSSGHEESVILEFMKKNNNIIYVKLPYDPGLYGVWNLAIKISSGMYIVNANLDDRVVYNCYEEYAKVLDEYPDIDLVYSDLYATHVPNLQANQANLTNCYLYYAVPEFSLQNMKDCLPNDHPMWRKTCHERWGFFDETYRSAGDYEMWARFIKGGARFKKVDKIYGVHYTNPKGLSTDHNKRALITEEVTRAKNIYQEFFDIYHTKDLGTYVWISRTL